MVDHVGRGYSRRPLAINAQKQTAALLLAWVGFGVRIFQSYEALRAGARPDIAPIGPMGLRRLAERSLPGDDRPTLAIKSELIAAIDHMFGGPKGVAPQGTQSKEYWQLAWLGAHLVAAAFGPADVAGVRFDPVLRPTPFAKGGFSFGDLKSQFPYESRTASEPAFVAYLKSFHDDKAARSDIQGLIEEFTADLYVRVRQSLRLPQDPFPYMFQRSAIWTAVLGFAAPRDLEEGPVYLIVREARSPSTPDWDFGHFLVRDLLFVKGRTAAGGIARAYYYSSNDGIVYELAEARWHENNTHCRLDGAKVRGNVLEHVDASALEMHKSLSLCVPRQLLTQRGCNVADGILFAQRGEQGTPGSWAVLASRCTDTRVEAIELALRQHITPDNAIAWLKQHRAIGAFPQSGKHNRALAMFLRRTAYASENWARKNVEVQKRKIAEIIGGVLEAQANGAVPKRELANDLALRIIESHRRHTERVAARSIILRDAHAPPSDVHSSSLNVRRLQSALFSLSVGLSEDLAP